MVRYLFYTIGDLTYQSPLVCLLAFGRYIAVTWVSTAIQYTHSEDER